MYNFKKVLVCLSLLLGLIVNTVACNNVENELKNMKTLGQCNTVAECPTFKFGKYFLDDDNVKKDIEWLVLDKKEDKVLLISKQILDMRSWASYGCSWADSELRTWLNGEFINTAFSGDELVKICETQRKGLAFLDTTDRVFVLNEEELEKYMWKKELREASITKSIYKVFLRSLSGNREEFVKGKNISEDSVIACWWLQVKNSELGYRVYTSGEYESCEGAEGAGVRPALWIKYK